MKHHVRGDSWHTDGLRQGKKHSFSLLVGIALTDTIVSNNGNLCVWPKSHLHIHHWMRHPDGMIRRIPHSNPSSAIPSVSNSATSTEGESLNVLSVTNCVGYSEASTTHCNTNADKNKTKETGDRDMQCNLVGYRDSDGSLPDLGPPVQVIYLQNQCVIDIVVIYLRIRVMLLFRCCCGRVMSCLSIVKWVIAVRLTWVQIYALCSIIVFATQIGNIFTRQDS